MFLFDGIEYEKESDIPNLGSIVATNAKGMLREYEGLSTDVDKLPKYATLRTGSTFFAIDTGEAYKYEATTKTWYKL